ncbi:MAG: ATP-binding cassette domain-containing protein [Planctomycetes bacterium]|nr:ATP-binding cassette domain-containing protein [Planctomycetota bacterium]
MRKVFTDGDGGEHVALRDVDLRIEAGELHVLIGTSGCGKTTTLRLVNRLEQPTGGRVLVGGADVRDEDPVRLRRRIGYVIQSGGLFPHWSVARNVGTLGELEGHAPDRIEARSRELLELVGLPFDEFGKRLPRELSGGQRQRVGIARALALDPDYMLLDEPFGALDPITRAELIAELKPTFARLGKTVLLVTHDLVEAFALGDRVTLMDRGSVVQTGTERDLLERPATELVERFVASVRGAR